MDQKWSHAKVLGKYFEVYGQASQITPEAGKKKAPFIFIIKFSYRRHSSTIYHKLDNNLEEAMGSNSDDTVRHVIY